MTPSANPVRVAAIVEPGPTRQQIATALSAQTEFQLVDVLDDLEKLVRDLRAAGPQIVLVDASVHGSPTIDILDDLSLHVPEAALIAILHNDDPMAAQQAVLAGARAYIVQPFTQVTLLSVLRRVHDLQSRSIQAVSSNGQSAAASESRGLKTLAVFSPRGGTGCTTIAANLAIAIYEGLGGRVLLMEGKPFFGHLDVMLNIRSRNNLVDLLQHASALDEGLIRDVVVEHISGIQVLLGPNDLQTSQGIRPQDLFNMLTGLQRSYDFIVIDAGSTLNENIVTLMDASDRILLVTNPDMASLHDTSRFIQISRSLAYPSEKLMVLLNRAGMLGGVKLKDIEKALRTEVFSTVPDDTGNSLRSLNRGIPLLLKYPHSPASRAIQKLAKALTVFSAKGSEAPAGEKTTPKARRQKTMASRSA